MICNEVLSNESLKDNKLKRHLNTKHSQLSDKNRKFFEIREQNLKRQRLDSVSNNFICTLKQATMASCVVAWHIARSKKAHAIGENLVKPAAIDMVRIMCGDDVAKKLDIVPLSNDTVRRRIASISANIKEQLISSIKKGREFSLQLMKVLISAMMPNYLFMSVTLVKTLWKKNFYSAKLWKQQREAKTCLLWSTHL